MLTRSCVTDDFHRGLFAAGKLAAPSGAAPQHVADRLADGPTHFAKDVTSSKSAYVRGILGCPARP